MMVPNNRKRMNANQTSESPTPAALAGVTCYVAVLRTWPQTGPENADLRIVTKALTGKETIDEVMRWASKLDYTTNVTITKAT